MNYVFITLKCAEQIPLDLKIPNYITGAELLKLLPEITGLEINADIKIQAEPIGRILDNEQTLFAEGVGNGALLTLL